MKNLNLKSLGMVEKTKKLSSILDLEQFSEFPFFYKRNIFAFLNHLDRELDQDLKNSEEIKASCLKVLYSLSPEMITGNSEYSKSKRKIYIVIH